MTLSYTGVGAGLILVSADDPSLHSSQNEQDNRYYGKFASIPVLEPADSQESLDMVKDAFEISEKFDTPVLFRMTTRISHSKGLVKIGERRTVEHAGFEKNIAKYVMVPSNAMVRHKIVIERLEALKKLRRDDASEQGRDGGHRRSASSPGASPTSTRKRSCPGRASSSSASAIPLPMNKIMDFASKVDRVIVVEELEPFYEEQILAAGIPCEGKKYFSNFMELNVERVRDGFIAAGVLPKSAAPAEAGRRRACSRGRRCCAPDARTAAS